MRLDGDEPEDHWISFPSIYLNLELLRTRRHAKLKRLKTKQFKSENRLCAGTSFLQKWSEQRYSVFEPEETAEMNSDILSKSFKER